MSGVTVSTHVVDVHALSTSAGGGDAISARATVGPSTGFPALEQHLLSCAHGRFSPRATGQAEEVLFVLAGTGVLRLAGVAHELERESGAYLAPGESYEIENRGADTLELVAVRIPPTRRAARVRPMAPRALSFAGSPTSKPRPPPRPASSGSSPTRTTGLRSATHFVGYIPSGRAPGSLPHLRRGDLRPRRRRRDARARRPDAGAAGLAASSCPPAGRPLPREHGRRRDAGRSGLQTRGLAGGRLLPGRDTGLSGGPVAGGVVTDSNAGALPEEEARSMKVRLIDCCAGARRAGRGRLRERAAVAAAVASTAGRQR